jgi:short-subunit dehydrogenase
MKAPAGAPNPRLRSRPQAPAPFTLITGASPGLGRALAEACARRGRNLALVALPGSGLPEAAAALASSYPVRVELLETDLAEGGGIRRVMNWLARRRIPVDTLINNAGISHHGPFRQAPPERLEDLVDLNIRALVLLTRRLLPELERHPRARILNVASLAAFHAMPHKAVYAPSKTFVLNFTLALREELRGTGVRASALCPGGIRTNPEVCALIEGLGRLARLSSPEPVEVAEYALHQLERGRAVIVPGAFNRLTRLAGSLVPRPLALAFIRRRLRGPG